MIKRVLSPVVFMVVLVALVGCNKVVYSVVDTNQPGLPESILSATPVLLGQKGPLLNLRGHYVFEEKDTYLWVNTDGRPPKVRSITNKDGVTNVVIDELDNAIPNPGAKLVSHLLIKFPGRGHKFSVTSAHENFKNDPEFDLLALELTRNDLAGTFIGLADANSAEIQVDADVAWPRNSAPTMFRLTDAVKPLVAQLATGNHVLISFRSNPQGDMFITSITKTSGPHEGEELVGLQASYVGLADANSFEVVFAQGQKLTGTAILRMIDELKAIVSSLKPGDVVIVNVVRDAFGQLIATDITKK